MQYIEMTIEEANEYFKGTKGKTVLVAVRDLETEEDKVISFIKKNKCDCDNILSEAETIVRCYDDLVNQLRAFTEKQWDIRNITPRGKLSTILLRE